MNFHSWSGRVDGHTARLHAVLRMSSFGSPGLEPGSIGPLSLDMRKSQGPPSPFCTRNTAGYPDRAATGPHFVPGLPHAVAHSRRPRWSWVRALARGARRRDRPDPHGRLRGAPGQSGGALSRHREAQRPVLLHAAATRSMLQLALRQVGKCERPPSAASSSCNLKSPRDNNKDTCTVRTHQVRPRAVASESSRHQARVGPRRPRYSNGGGAVKVGAVGVPALGGTV